MMNQIQNQLKAESAQEDRFSENGARMHASTGTALLDCNFKVASYRQASQSQIIQDFSRAWEEDPELALKWLFFVRDIREGLGERNLFRVAFKYAISIDKRAHNLIRFIPEYGRWDDMIALWGISADIDNIIAIRTLSQLQEDEFAMNAKESATLLAKWLPSVNTSSKDKRKMARTLIAYWNKVQNPDVTWTERTYRKRIAALRAYLDVTEVKLASKRVGEIKYEAVPSQANLKYRNAFLRLDEDRRREFLGRLEKGETKINAATSFPHDIVHGYFTSNSGWRIELHHREDQTLEGMWKALPQYGIEDTIVVADGSGSMTSTIGNSNVTALEVANALAIYCSQNNKGEFKDKYITFSSKPQFVDFSKGQNMSLLSRLGIALTHNEVANTNVYSVFKLILNTAVKNKMSQEEMVKNILIISDMEFDAGTENATEKLFDQIKREYREAEYELPRCVFWNVNSRTGAIPVVNNDRGVALVSGFSPSIVKMVMSNKLDPFEALLDVLNGKRYEDITLRG